MEIVILDGGIANTGDLSWEKFKKLGNVRIFESSSRKNAVERIGSAQAVIINRVVMSQDIIEASPCLEYIGILSTGYNIIDFDAANKKILPCVMCQTTVLMLWHSTQYLYC